MLLVTEKLLTQSNAVHKSITKQMHLDVGDMKPRIHNILFSQVLAALRPKVLPEDNLFKCRSLTSRVSNMRPSPINAANFKLQLGGWLSRNDSSLFIIRAGSRAEIRSKQIAIDLITLLQSSGCGVIWNLSALVNAESRPSIPGLVKGLVFQILETSKTCRPMSW